MVEKGKEKDAMLTGQSQSFNTEASSTTVLQYLLFRFSFTFIIFSTTKQVTDKPEFLLAETQKPRKQKRTKHKKRERENFWDIARNNITTQKAKYRYRVKSSKSYTQARI